MNNLWIIPERYTVFFKKLQAICYKLWKKGCLCFPAYICCMYKNVICLTLILLLAACDLRSNLEFKKERERIGAYNNMMQADVEFSRRSEEVGLRRAFLEYIDNSTVILRPGSVPWVGADAVDKLSGLNDSLVVLRWTPQGGDISKAGDMGYTYGVYDMEVGDSVYTGSYVTIWKQQADGNWRFSLDSRNEGKLPEE